MRIFLTKYFLNIIAISFMSVNILAQVKDSVKFTTKEIRVYSNKIITDNFNSPVKIQSFGKSDIQNTNGNNLSDVLELAGGVFIKNYGGNSSLSTVSMNGMGAEHTLVLLNGFKLNSAQNSQTDLSLISKENITNIEVLNNGSSSIYGSSAMGGVINILTNKEASEKFKINVTGQIGSYSQNKYLIRLNNRMNKFSYDVSFSKESSLNNYQYYFSDGRKNQLKNRVNSNYDILNYNFYLNYEPEKNSTINFYSDLSDAERRIPGIETGSDPSKAVQKDKNWNSILSYENFLSGSLNFKTQFNYQNNLTNYSDGGFTESYYKNLSLGNLSQFNFKAGNNEYISGYELSYASINSNELSPFEGRFQGSIFFVSEVNLNKQLKFFPSVRYDHFSDINENVMSGKLGFNYKPFLQNNLHFKFSAGNNFSSPTFNELYWNNLGNENLKPEKSFNADAGVIYGFGKDGSNTIELTYTYINAKDKILWTPNSAGLWIPENISNSLSNIFSLDIHSHRINYGDISAQSGLRYSYSSVLKSSEDYPGDPAYKKQIIYVPENLLKLNLSFSFKETGLNLFYNFTGKRFSDIENLNSLPEVSIVDGNLYQNLLIAGISAQIKLEVNNILNENYQIISGYPMPLRNFKLNLNIEY